MIQSKISKTNNDKNLGYESVKTTNVNLIQSLSIINDFSPIIFIKDHQHRYIGANKKFLGAVGLSDINSLIGRNDYDFSWSNKQANKQIRSDNIVYRGNTIYNSYEPRWYTNGERIVVINKIPLENDRKEIIGVLGTHHDVFINKAEFLKINNTNISLKNHNSLVFSSIRLILDAPLSNRELECLCLWICGFSLKESSWCLNISERTIESHRNKVTEKLNVKRKFELLELMMSNGVLNIMLNLSKVYQKMMHENLEKFHKN